MRRAEALVRSSIVEDEAGVRRLFAQALEEEKDGAFVFRCLGETCRVRPRDPGVPYVLRGVRFVPGSGPLREVWLRLGAGVEEPLDPATLEVGSGNVLYARVRGGRFRARFSRAAYYAIADRIEPLGTGFALVLDGVPHRIPDRAKEAPPAGIEFTVRRALTNGELNGLFSVGWPSWQTAPDTSDWMPVLAHSLVWITADAGRRLVGFVNVAWDGRDHAFLLDPRVDPEYRHRGIGSELVRRAVDAARAAGCTVLHVDYDAAHAAFYAACGFHPTTAGIVRL
ncbi:MAG: GNAT family N-acetyltransferase [Acidobacteriota bacterium]